MSEDKSRFKIKKGDIEIEYEGKPAEVNTRFTEAFEWIREASLTSAKPESTKRSEKVDKPSKTGGPRTGVIAPAIDRLIKEGFFDDFKSVAQALKELRRKTVPVSGLPPVNMALNRRVPKTLDRIKDKNGRWVYRKKQG